MQRLCDWVKGRSVSAVVHLHLHLHGTILSKAHQRNSHMI